MPKLSPAPENISFCLRADEYDLLIRNVSLEADLLRKLRVALLRGSDREIRLAPMQAAKLIAAVAQAVQSAESKQEEKALQGLFHELRRAFGSGDGGQQKPLHGVVDFFHHVVVPFCSGEEDEEDEPDERSNAVFRFLQLLPAALVETLAENWCRKQWEEMAAVEAQTRAWYPPGHALSLQDLFALISDKRFWHGGEAILTLNSVVPPRNLEQCPIYVMARAVLEVLAPLATVRLTEGGALNRALVREVVARCPWRLRAGDDDLEDKKPRNEADIPYLTIARILCRIIGAIEETVTRCRITERGRALLLGGNESRFFNMLFEGYFCGLDVSMRDEMIPLPLLQYSMPFILFYLRRMDRQWHGFDYFDARFWLPGVREALHGRVRVDERQEIAGCTANETLQRVRYYVLYWRVLKPLTEFGLLEQRDLPKAQWTAERRWMEFRKTPFADKFLSFDFGRAADTMLCFITP